MADTDLWRRDGDRSAAHHLARTTGTTVGAAADALAVGRRLDQLPDTAAAARRGELSPSQVSAIADAAGADPSAEARLVDAARHSSLQELKDDCARTKAAASADAEARRRRIHDSRYLRTYTGADGAWNMHVRNNVINPICDRLFAEARAEGRREPHEAYAADALTALARNAGTATAADAWPADTAKANTGVRVDLGALLRGYPVSGELAELVGYGPVAVSVIRDMIDSGDPFLTAVATKGVDVVGVAHLGRRPTAHQRTALEWLHPTCAVEGCSAVARLEMDHREDWATTHVTLFSLIDRLCAHHHGLKTRETGAWSTAGGSGRSSRPPTSAIHDIPGRHSVHPSPRPPARRVPPEAEAGSHGPSRRALAALTPG